MVDVILEKGGIKSGVKSAPPEPPTQEKKDKTRAK